MKILFISHTAIGGPFVVGSHHLSRYMAKLGHTVVHLSPPVTPAHISVLKKPFERERFKRWLRNGRVIDGVFDLVPAGLLTWGQAKRFGDPFVTYGKSFIRSATKLLKKAKILQPDIIFIDEPRLGYLLKKFSDSKIVYRPTDVYSKIRNDESIIDAEKEIIKLANAFIATSEPVAEHLRSLLVKDVMILENGVDLEHFTNGIDYNVEAIMPPHPRVVYAGALDHRFGIDSLLEAAQVNSTASFVLLGPITLSVKEKIESEPNIYSLGAIEYEKLPSYLRRCDLAMLPMSDDPSNQGRSPMKLYEYAAIGLPIVATSTLELERRNMSALSLSKTSKEFSDLIAKALTTTFDSHEIKAFAEDQDWRQKSKEAILYAKK
jgi:teichuronic acid biosynthesis glycosyltransferase TuaH